MIRKLGICVIPCSLALAITAGCLPQEGAHPVDRVLPTAETMQIKLPERQAQQLSLGSIAETYVWTRQITQVFNGGAAFVLILVHTVVQYPPTEVQGDTAIWEGSDALDPAIWRLTVTELADGSYDWELSGRNKTTPEDGFITMISGNAVPGSDNRGSGSFLLDFDAIHRVDPIDNPDAAGRVEVTYDLENRDGTQGTLDMHIETLVNDHGQNVPVTADYAYAENADGSGDFQFTFVGDIDENGSAFENARIRSRWQADGAGRSDVRATDGDLGSSSASFSQCWNTQFRTVYEDFSVLEGGAAAGDPSLCAYETMELPQ
jgi:hypothetical protein